MKRRIESFATPTRGGTPSPERRAAAELCGLALLSLGVLGIWLTLAAPGHLVLVVLGVALQGIVIIARTSPAEAPMTPPATRTRTASRACGWCLLQDCPWHRAGA